MNLAIVGGNSKIGTELCFILRRFGIEPTPVVRNGLGATFLRYHGFQCRIGDVGVDNVAEGLLRDMDTVAIAAYDTHWGKAGRAANKKLVSNCVRYSAPESKVIYFSSIRAYSRKVDKGTPRWWFAPAHDREKRYLESQLFNEARKNARKGFAFRIGHVFGKNQSRTRQLIGRLSASDAITVEVSPDKPSNVLHTVSLAEAITLCMKGSVPAGTYSLVNHPQWTWREVLDYYAPTSTKVTLNDRVKPSGGTSLSRRLVRHILGPLIRSGGFGYTLKLVVPDSYRRAYSRDSQLQLIRQEIDELESTTLRMHEFQYGPAPGKEVPGLSITRDILENYEVPAGIFDRPAS